MKKLDQLRKLPLRKEVVRELKQDDLDDVVGGNVTSTLQPSHIFNKCN